MKANERGDHLECPRVDGMIILKRMFKKNGGNTWTGLVWLKVRISCGGGLL
jgi:hypothetical protein